MIASVHATLGSLGKAPEPEASIEPLKPAVSVKKAITDEFIISLEDGRKLKSMKRYLAKLGMTPDEYRAKWGLPGDYPMVAPAYAAQRSELAKNAGLGRRGSQDAVEAAPEVDAQPASGAPKKAGRGGKEA